jgi:UDP-glucose 4-epimerase
MLATNVPGTANLLRAAERQGCQAFVHAGSGAEYGPLDEAVREDSPLRPRGPYAIAKAAASLLSLQAAVPAVVVRIFGAYGPGEREDRLLPYVVGCYLRGEAPRLSDGAQRRDFIHVEDVVRLLRLAGDTPAAHGRVLHAATGQAWSVREAVELIRSACSPQGPPPLFGTRPTRPDEPGLYLGCRERTTALTGWRPTYDLPTGTRITVSHLLDQHRALAG